MTEEERERFLPVTRTFVKVLENDNATPEEINLLLEQSSELSNLIPDFDGQTGKQNLVLFSLSTYSKNLINWFIIISKALFALN